MSSNNLSSASGTYTSGLQSDARSKRLRVRAAHDLLVEAGLYPMPHDGLVFVYTKTKIHKDSVEEFQGITKEILGRMRKRYYRAIYYAKRKGVTSVNLEEIVNLVKEDSLDLESAGESKRNLPRDHNDHIEIAARYMRDSIIWATNRLQKR